MMGQISQDQGQLFYSFNLERVVPDDHMVRALARVLDLSSPRPGETDIIFVDIRFIGGYLSSHVSPVAAIVHVVRACVPSSPGCRKFLVSAIQTLKDR
jgi:hypothetical protein